MRTHTEILNKPSDYLTTYQSVIAFEGFLKSHAQHLGQWPDLQEGESNYPVKTYTDLLDKFYAGHYSVNPETGFVTGRIEASALNQLWSLLDRVRIHSTNR